MKTNLLKTLGLTDVFCISVGAMISSGIFILPGMAFARIGPAVFLSYLLAGICALLGSLATIELATAMPRSGGIYFYTVRSLGPIAGTISGLLNWSAIALKSSFAIFGMSEVMYQLLGLNPYWCGIFLVIVFMIINLIGTSAAAWTQIFMVLLLLAAMIAYIVLDFPQVQVSRFSPLFAGDKSHWALWAEAAFVFVSFGGLLDVASVSEEIKNPKRDLPSGMISGIIVVMVLYVLTLIVTVGVSDPEKLAKSLTPLADVAQARYGLIGFIVITAGAIMAFVTTANAGLMAASRFPFAMARDQLVPELFSRTYGKRNMPLPALFLTGGVMMAVQFLPLEKLVTVASTVIMVSFILTNLAVIILRESNIQNYQPSFKTPLYPLMPILSIGLFCLLIVDLGMASIQITLGMVFAGFLIYFFFGRRVKFEYALMHLVQRIGKFQLTGHDLENELREIVRARDGIVYDDVDEIIKRAHIEIVDDLSDFELLCRKVAKLMGKKTGMPALELFDRLMERERVSTTVITPEVAIPHIQVDGQEFFEVVIIKNPKGIFFSAESDRVYVVVFLFTSLDCRHLHLKSIAAIAQIIQNPEFYKKWQRARTPEQLRDIFLLAKRKRIHKQ